MSADSFQGIAPHRLPDELVREAEDTSRVPVALYLVALDGLRLVRLAGGERFPARLDVTGALGPELPRETYPELIRALQVRLPGCVATPLTVYDRAVGFFVAARAPAVSLEGLADRAAAVMEVAGGYTDRFERVRRAEPISAAAEIQQNLLPPRIASLEGADLAATILPTYDVGGDWFDHAENPEGTWLAVADGVGKGPRAGAIAATALAALRAARRNGRGLAEAAQDMHQVVAGTFGGADFVTAVLALWVPDTRELRWLTFGHPRPLLVHLDGAFEELTEAVSFPLGIALQRPDWRPARRTLRAGQRLILYSDGVSERRTAAGTLLGLEGIRAAVAAAGGVSAAATAAALASAVRLAAATPLRDDATVMVLRVTGEG